MFYQNLTKFRLPNNRISSLPSVAGTNLRAHFTSFKSCTHKLALYAGCYGRGVFKTFALGLLLLLTLSCGATQKDFGAPWVRLTFDISETGNPINIKVTDADPKKIFDDAAISAIAKWKYKPKLVDGVAVVQKDLEVQLDFKLDDASDN